MATRGDIEKILHSEHELASLVNETFAALDDNHSGYIDKNELRSMMISVARDVGAEMPSDTEVSEVMADIDRNSDGKIDKEEFKGLIIRVLRCILDNELT